MMRRILYGQFLPKKEEVENNEVKSLAKRLKGKNDAETLSNILEWEDRNLTFWHDRWLIHLIILVIIALSTGALLQFLEVHMLLSIVIAPFLLVVLWRGKLLEILIPLTFSFCIILFMIVGVALSVEKVLVPSNLLTFSIIISLLVGASLSMIFYLMIRYGNIKRSVPEFRISDTFMLSLPIDKILKYQLSVCRDYAKLTMALLLNLYPSGDLYFIEIPRHVAAAVKLDKTIYVLDQKLPILGLKKWTLRWKERLRKKRLKPQLLRVVRNIDGGIKVEHGCLQCEVNSTPPKIDLKGVADGLKRELLIREDMHAKNPEEFRLLVFKKFEMFYEDDGIIRHSIERLVKRKIENEFCGRIQDLMGLDLQIENGDLILRARLKGEEK